MKISEVKIGDLVIDGEATDGGGVIITVSHKDNPNVKFVDIIVTPEGEGEDLQLKVTH